MLDDNKRREWTNLATEHIGLRFPKINLGVVPSFNYNKSGRVSMETFVPNKKGTRLVLARELFYTSPEEDIWASLDVMKKRFIQKCELIREKHIFN